jgi:hypothetical protein
MVYPAIVVPRTALKISATVAGFWLALFVPAPDKSLSVIWLKFWMNRVDRRRIG